MDALVAIAVAFACGGLLVVTPVGMVAVHAVAVVALRGRPVVLVLALALAAAGLRAHVAIAAHEERVAAVGRRSWPARCEVSGEVVRAPTLAGAAFRVEILGEVRCRDEPPLPALVALHGPFPVGRGDRVLALASLAPPSRFFVEDLADPRPAAARRGIVLSGGAEDVLVLAPGRGVGAWLDRARQHVRGRIAATFPPETAPLARALVLGEEDLAPDDRDAFRRSGLAHLLAVSGTHLVLVVMGCVAALRGVLARLGPLAAGGDVGRIAAAIGLPLAWLYADFAGGSGSAVRAAWMCSLTLLARAAGRRTRPWRAFGLSVLAMALVDPLVIFDLSFDLSALATLGLLVLSRPIAGALDRRAPWMPAAVKTALAATLAATTACTPVIATMGGELPVGGVLANLVAGPLGEAAALPLCLVHALLAPWPDAERGVALVASGALACVRYVALRSATTGVALPPVTAAELTIAASTAVWLGLARRRGLGLARRALLAGVIAFTAAELLVRRAGAPRGELRITFLDVGQGDAALVDLPDGTALLVDGGGLVGSPVDVGERVVAPVLAARRRSVLRAMVLSHPHPDHYLGLGTAFAGSRPGALWDTGQGEVEDGGPGYRALLGRAREAGVPVLRPSALCGAHELGGATVTVLAPCPGPVPDRGANDNSFVLRIAYGRRAVLLVGDAEHAEEAELLARGADVRADVLKVGHHGSRTSSGAAFLAAVRPELAVISTGTRNRFGHPHPETVAALAAVPGLRVARTDRDGSVVVRTDGRSLEIRTARAR